MDNTALNIGALFTEVFGISSPIYLPWGRKLNDYDPGKYSGLAFTEPTKSEYNSWMGTPVIGSFELDGRKDYATYDVNGNRTTINISSFRMPYATIVDFTQAKNVSKTKVLGTRGTVKEIYGNDDWNIQIRGFCINDKSRSGYKTPEEQMSALITYGKVMDAIGVTGSIFNDKEIYSIVIEELSFNPIQGNSSIIPFTIRACSDTPKELQL